MDARTAADAAVSMSEPSCEAAGVRVGAGRMEGASGMGSSDASRFSCSDTCGRGTSAESTHGLRTL